MKRCIRCGSQLDDGANYCSQCGERVAYVQYRGAADRVNLWLCLLAFLFPPFGLFYWAAVGEERPERAQACGIVGLVTLCVDILMVGLALTISGVLRYLAG